MRIRSIEEMNSVRNKTLEFLKPIEDAIKNKRKSLESDLLAAKNEITLCNKRSEERNTRIKELETQLNTRIKELEAQLNTHQTISNRNAEVIKEHQVANEQEKAKSANLFNVLVSLKNFMDDAIDEQDMAPIVAYVKDEYGVDLEWESSDKE
jgi:vacuolar-type H+-ATPase subunit I/STV1